MRPLILQPTEMSQWHALLNEAQVATNHLLKETTESYLLHLLIRFTKGAQWIESILAVDFLYSFKQPKQQRIAHLREVGDKSLLFCGLFPGVAHKRRVSLNYYVDIGQSAYLYLSDLEDSSQAYLYYELSEQFQILQQILNAMHEI